MYLNPLYFQYTRRYIGYMIHIQEQQINYIIIIINFLAGKYELCPSPETDM